MKKLIAFIVLVMCLSMSAQLNYSFTATSGTYAAITTGTTSVHAPGVDDAISSAITLPFTFQYNCTNYTSIKISSNGWFTFNTGITGSNNTNDLDNATNGLTNPLIVAPLWDDLEVNDGTAANDGFVRYNTTGASPNRVFTIEWYKMRWNYAATADVISFQCKLYETTNQIEFIYLQGATAVNSASASCGLMGATTGTFISLQSFGASPTTSTTTETSNLSSKPATNQIYRFDPVTCTGAPAGGTASASVAAPCYGGTSILSVSGGSTGCGISYQWQSSATSGGPWSTIAGATGATYTATITATTYYRRLETCSASGQSTGSAEAVVTLGSCYMITNGATAALSCPGSYTFYDSGGSGSNYTSNENAKRILCHADL
jgi:hypothetical protein